MKKLSLIFFILFLYSSFAFAINIGKDSGSVHKGLRIGGNSGFSFGKQASNDAIYWRTARTDFWNYARTGLWEVPRNSPVATLVHLTYDDNDATSGNAPNPIIYESGATATILDNIGTLAKTGYTFSGWNTAADGSGTDYAAEATFEISGDTTLYAKWVEDIYLAWDSSSTSQYVTLSASDSIATAVGGGAKGTKGNIAKSTGKHYFEIKIKYSDSSRSIHIGVSTSQAALNKEPGLDAYGWGYMGYFGYFYHNNQGYNLGAATFTTNDILQIAVDLDAHKIWFGKNNTWQASGNPAAGTSPVFDNLSGSVMPSVSLSANLCSVELIKAAGATYSPPSGFVYWE